MATKLAYGTFSPITLGAARFLIAAVILGVLVAAKRGFVKPRREDLAMLALSGILGIPLYFTLENIGVKLTTASNAALIVASYPAITVLLELLFYKVKPTRNRIIGIALAIAGVFLLSYAGLESTGKNQLLGNVILVFTGVVWSLYNFTTRKVVNNYPAFTLSLYQTVAGTICFIPLAFIEKDAWQPLTAVSWAALFYLGVLCSVAAFILYNFGLRRLSSGTAVSLMNLVPVFGVVFSFFILHETVSLWQIAGGVVVIAGVFLSAMPVKERLTQ